MRYLKKFNESTETELQILADDCFVELIDDDFKIIYRKIADIEYISLYRISFYMKDIINDLYKFIDILSQKYDIKTVIYTMYNGVIKKDITELKSVTDEIYQVKICICRKI